MDFPPLLQKVGEAKDRLMRIRRRGTRRLKHLGRQARARLDPAIVEDSVVDIISGGFRGRAARVMSVSESKEEVTVELFEMAVPVALTVRADQIRVKLERGSMVRIDTYGRGRRGDLLAGLIGRVVAIDEEADSVDVRVYDSEVLDIVRVRGSVDYVLPRECITITHSLDHALRVYCRHCDRLQGGGSRGLCEEHEEQTEAIYQYLNGPMEEEE